MRRLLVWSGTWNVATHRPHPSTGKPSIHNLFNNINVAPDIVSLGFQELLSQLHVPLYWKRDLLSTIPQDRIDERSEPWIDKITEAIHKKFKAEYTLLVSVNMAAIGLVVLVKSDLVPTIKSVSTGTLGSGFLGIYPNKGAVAVGIEIEFPDSTGTVSLCLVSSHLQAHAGESFFIWRNMEIQHLLSTLVLSDPIKSWGRYINDFDSVFFCGDTNYRLVPDKTGSAFGIINNSIKSVTVPRDRNQIYSLIDTKNVETLLSLDELSYARLHLRCPPLDAFQEAQISFLPSYKYRVLPTKAPIEMDLPAKDIFSETRIPAYCDRILYKSSHSDVDCLGYTSVTSLGWSDHQPVIGLFRLTTTAHTSQPVNRDYRRLRTTMLWAQFSRFVSVNVYALGILVAVIVGYIFA